ncbi:MAG: virulence RhuM family protein [Candidatus Moranbacteria bacterium]|nr:virulence RhuM family protein [Candidatus Moranbacteria bacterium]
MKKEHDNEIIIYEGENGTPSISVRMQGETVWLNQAQLVELFDSSKSNISEHIKNIFAEGELARDSVVRNFRTTAADGKTYDVEHYNLDMIISLGYRVKSKIATHFRQWATARLKEYIVKGFTMDDARLKELGGGGYWKELLARIRDIRASEKVFYRQILDIYATSIDYDAQAEVSQEFFKRVQNKVHYAVHGSTAAEVIYNRADAEKDFMGLTTFAGAQPRLAEAKIAKNYLNEKELRALGQIVSGYLDFAERQAEREVPMKMADWAKHLDAILTSTGEELLLDAGAVSHEQAMEKAEGEYKKYRQKTLSDVERAYLDSITALEKKVEKKVREK